MRNFKSYDLAVAFYQIFRKLKLPTHLRCQLERAAASVVLNLAEGYGRSSPKDQRRFYDIALGSIREVQAGMAISDIPTSDPNHDLLDHLAASVFKLVRKLR